MLVQFAKYLEEEANKSGQQNVSVQAEVSCSLNGRPRNYLVDPKVDLSKVEYPFYKRADWIMPLIDP